MSAVGPGDGGTIGTRTVVDEEEAVVHGRVTHGMRLLGLRRSGDDTTLLLDEAGRLRGPSPRVPRRAPRRPRPSLNKVLRDLGRAGVVEFSYRCVDIVDPVALARVAGRPS